MIKLFYQILIHDRNGHLIRKTKLRISHSFVLQFLLIICTQFDSTTSHNIPDITNTPKAITANSNNLILNGGAGDTFGIVVGSGIAAEDNEDYSLATIINHGGGAGELNHGSQSVIEAGVVGSNVDLVISRPFVNGSAGNVLVKEIGAYCKAGGAAGDRFCILRDVLPATETVAPTETLTAQYTLRTTV